LLYISWRKLTSKAKMAVPKKMGNWRPEVNQGTESVLAGGGGAGLGKVGAIYPVITSPSL
jgi:hypothetical protein